MDNHSHPDFSQSGPGEHTAKSAGVRRVNNMPMYIVGAAIAAFLLIMVLVANSRGNKTAAVDKAAAAERKGGSAQLLAEQIAGKLGGGIVASLEPAAPIAPIDLDAPPVLIARPDRASAAEPPAEESPLEKKLKAMKLAQLEQAIKAKTTMGSRPTRSPASAPSAEARQQEPAAERMRAGGPRPGPSAADLMAQVHGGGSGGSAPRPNNSLEQFTGASDKEDRWQLSKATQAPRTPYELRAGFVIPATLISGINSELPGQIMGQVTQDVYDTATGKHRLIPQGSRLVGAYTSEVAYGQSRVMAAWQRIIFPDGKALDIGAMPAADAAGYGGLSDKVNNHYFRIFGSAVLLSGITAGITQTLDKTKGSSSSTVPNIQDSLNAALANQLGQVAIEMIRKNMNIAPTLEIRPGFRFNVMVVKDLTFTKPYQAFDY